MRYPDFTTISPLAPLAWAMLFLAMPACDADTPRTDSGPETAADPAHTHPSSDTEPFDDTTTASSSPTDSPSLSSEGYRSIVELVALREHGKFAELETVDVTTTDDPAYGTEKHLRGWPLPSLLERFADLPDDRTGYVIQFVATDGYRATVPLEKLPADAGVLAFRDLDAPRDQRWVPFSHGDRQTTPAPFYLVWPGTEDGDNHRPWAYKLAKIAVARADKLWGEAVPDQDPSLRPGFRVFRNHCMKCHSINLAGGSVGPELNVPRNVTEYWKETLLPDYIRHPTSFRADAQMPSMAGNLSDDDMAALLKYLRGMANAKICESRSACQNRLDQP